LQKKPLEREYKTIREMIDLSCSKRHGAKPGELCPSCRKLLSYAQARLDKCPYREKKPACARCPVHCYKPAMRDRIRDVMRWAGPRMMRHHPLLALRHLLDGWKTPMSR
jgi:hypothetical protein